MEERMFNMLKSRFKNILVIISFPCLLSSCFVKKDQGKGVVDDDTPALPVFGERYFDIEDDYKSHYNNNRYTLKSMCNRMGISTWNWKDFLSDLIDSILEFHDKHPVITIIIAIVLVVSTIIGFIWGAEGLAFFYGIIAIIALLAAFGKGEVPLGLRLAALAVAAVSGIVARICYLFIK